MTGLFYTLHAKMVFGRRVRILAQWLSHQIPIGASVLDVGCGNGQISAEIMQLREKVSITGIDVLLRPKCYIPVTQFDGKTIPFTESSSDVVMFVDVLHHTRDPKNLLTEAVRVTKKYILIKDHLRNGILSGPTLRLMDWVGNAHHGVALPYNYLSESEWQRIYDDLGLRLLEVETALGLYPQPANLIFGRKLHFIALLEKC
jgi:ubiquinone/menaquinone biosynthesis C-methylase UbiE